MADKEFPLSIVLRTVDKATAGINAINAKLDRLTRPTREFGKAIGDLAEKSGLKAVGEGFAGIGGAVKDLAGKMLAIGGVAAGVVVAFAGVVGSFDDLGDKAEGLGVSVDFLASMRDAAERSGSSIDALDSGVASLSMNMGLLRAGTGKMTGFLKVVSPVLLTQLKATKSNEEAFLLLADAMAKIQDPAKRAAFAQKTLGDASLAPLLARGSKGINELRKHYTELAGSQEDAVKAAGEVDESMHNLTAATAGIKAALVAGLAPALKIVIDKLTEWLSGHREDIKRWADDIGKKLPGAIDAVVKAVSGAVKWVTEFVDNIGGVKVALVGLAAVMVGPIVSAFTTLGVAMLTTPFGAVLASLAAISALVISVTGEIEKMSDAMDTSHEIALQDLAEDTMKMDTGEITAEEFRRRHPDPLGGDFARRAVTTPMGLLTPPRDFRDIAREALPIFAQPARPAIDLSPFEAHAQAVLSGRAPQEVNLKVDFANAPHGLRVAADPKNTVNVDTKVGYQMLGAWP